MTRASTSDEIDDPLHALAELPDPPIPDLVDRRALLCARAELARTGPGALATAGRLYRRVLAPAASLAVAAAHLVWVLDAVASLYR